MNSFEELCTDIFIELGRDLEIKELEFLRWLYQRHIEEQEIENRIDPKKFA